MLKTVPTGYQPLSPRAYAAADAKLQSLSSHALEAKLAEAQTNHERDARILAAEHNRLDRLRETLTRASSRTRAAIAAARAELAEGRETLANLRLVAKATAEDTETARAELEALDAELSALRARAAGLRLRVAEAEAERRQLAKANDREETRIWNARNRLARQLLKARPIDSAIDALLEVARDAPSAGKARKRVKAPLAA